MKLKLSLAEVKKAIAVHVHAETGIHVPPEAVEVWYDVNDSELDKDHGIGCEVNLDKEESA